MEQVGYHLSIQKRYNVLLYIYGVNYLISNPISRAMSSDVALFELRGKKGAFF